MGHVMSDPWKKLAVEAWDAPSWREAARGYRDARGGRVLIAEIDPGRSQLLRRLMGDDNPRSIALGTKSIRLLASGATRLQKLLLTPLNLNCALMAFQN